MPGFKQFSETLVKGSFIMYSLISFKLAGWQVQLLKVITLTQQGKTCLQNLCCGLSYHLQYFNLWCICHICVVDLYLFFTIFCRNKMYGELCFIRGFIRENRGENPLENLWCFTHILFIWEILLNCHYFVTFLTFIFILCYSSNA